MIFHIHQVGRRDMESYLLGYAAMAAGADGIIVETHYNPDEELVDRVSDNRFAIV